MPTDVRLREVIQSDLPIFFEQQRDPDATRMAAFPARDRDSFLAHWANILPDHSNTIRTILFNGEVAGNVVCFRGSSHTLIGYWLGKPYWGKGVATEALSQFLRIVKTRPLYAYVARHNIASIRVLEKCEFALFDDSQPTSPAGEAELEEFLYKLDDKDN